LINGVFFGILTDPFVFSLISFLYPFVPVSQTVTAAATGLANPENLPPHPFDYPEIFTFHILLSSLSPCPSSPAFVWENFPFPLPEPTGFQPPRYFRSDRNLLFPSLLLCPVLSLFSSSSLQPHNSRTSRFWFPPLLFLPSPRSELWCFSLAPVPLSVKGNNKVLGGVSS